MYILYGKKYYEDNIMKTKISYSIENTVFIDPRTGKSSEFMPLEGSKPSKVMTQFNLLFQDHTNQHGVDIKALDKNQVTIKLTLPKPSLLSREQTVTLPASAFKSLSEERNHKNNPVLKALVDDIKKEEKGNVKTHIPVNGKNVHAKGCEGTYLLKQ